MDRYHRRALPPLPGQLYASPERLSVAEALDVFVRVAVAKAPVLDEERLRAEYRMWNDRCGGTMTLARGPVTEVAAFLAGELQRNATRDRYDGNQVVVLDEAACIQVYTSYGTTAGAWRVWRTADGLALCLTRRARLTTRRRRWSPLGLFGR
jgi:hypothetical protein